MNADPPRPLSGIELDIRNAKEDLRVAQERLDRLNAERERQLTEQREQANAL